MYTLNHGDTVAISGSTDNGWYLLSDGGYIRKDMVGDSSERHDSDDHGNVVEGNEYTVHVNNIIDKNFTSPDYRSSNPSVQSFSSSSL